MCVRVNVSVRDDLVVLLFVQQYYIAWLYVYCLSYKKHTYISERSRFVLYICHWVLSVRQKYGATAILRWFLVCLVQYRYSVVIATSNREAVA